MFLFHHAQKDVRPFRGAEEKRSRGDKYIIFRVIARILSF